jgi:hypothetical protein
MKNYSVKIESIELDNGLGDYYNDLMELYLDNELPTCADESKFCDDVVRLLREPIEFSDRLSILNALLTSIKRPDVWHLIRFR